jgi:hypothetical protein
VISRLEVDERMICSIDEGCLMRTDLLARWQYLKEVDEMNDLPD